MTERYETTAGQRYLRLRTDDGPVIELTLSVTDSTIDARVAVYDADPSVPLATMTGAVLRERRGVVDRVAKLILKQNPDPEDLWAALNAAYNAHKGRWSKATAAATQAADAALAAAPEADRAGILRTTTQSILDRLP
jgi:hypothetical protein